MTAARRKGPTEAAFERALTVARAADRLGPEDAAIVAAGRAAARLVDDASRSTDPKSVWMREAAIRRYCETLAVLQLTPSSRPNDGTNDPFIAALNQLMDQEQQHAREWHTAQSNGAPLGPPPPTPNGAGPI